MFVDFSADLLSSKKVRMWEEMCPVRFFYTATALGQSCASNHSAFLPLFSFEAAGFCGLIHMEIQAKKRVLRCSSIYGRGSPQSPREAHRAQLFPFTSGAE